MSAQSKRTRMRLGKGEARQGAAAASSTWGTAMQEAWPRRRETFLRLAVVSTCVSQAHSISMYLSLRKALLWGTVMVQEGRLQEGLNAAELVIWPM